MERASIPSFVFFFRVDISWGGASTIDTKSGSLADLGGFDDVDEEACRRRSDVRRWQRRVTGLREVLNRVPRMRNSWFIVRILCVRDALVE